MTVYVVQQPKPTRNGFMPDLSSASDYGKVEYIYPSDERVYAMTGPAMFRARKIAREYNPDKDYILWAGGDPAAVMAVFIALGEMHFDEIKTLYWDRKRNATGQRDGRSGSYMPVTYHLCRKVQTV